MNHLALRSRQMNSCLKFILLQIKLFLFMYKLAIVLRYYSQYYCYFLNASCSLDVIVKVDPNIGESNTLTCMARVQCFAILTTDSRAVCWAGGILEGKVVLNIITPLIVRGGIRITLHGESRVQWTDDQRTKQKNKLSKYPKTGRKNDSNVQETEIYSKTSTILSGPDHEHTHNHILPVGNHRIPFEIPVASDLPSTFKGLHGYIRYWLQCIIDAVYCNVLTAKKFVTVISKYNSNTDLLANKQIKRQQKVSLSCGCGLPGYYDIKYNVARRGYVPGEKIMIDMRSRNFTSCTIHLVLLLKMTTTYCAQGKSLRVNKTLHKEQKILKSAETLIWTPEIPVQHLPPTGLGGSRMIDIRYWLEVDMYSKAYFTDTMHFSDEIRIGSLPMNHITTSTTTTDRLFRGNNHVETNQLHPAS